MRYIVAVAALLPAAFAWNQKVCNGAGGCVGTDYNPEGPFRCPDGTRLNFQQIASNSIAGSDGSYDIVTKDQFPTSCLTGRQPTDKETLVVHHTQFKQKMYMILKETCNTPNPINLGDCYSQTPNPGTTHICQLVDATGSTCKMNVNAGQCETWATSVGGAKCEGWTIDKPDFYPRDG
ncbi:hypothetical protein GQ44DRAFT_601236 [Phaeosphaeriaceae sp. PMI808]|nr:hypothetical protein GQ44DRAFT_601236 [Phaeosphaeriaceae sp. PMI808]